MSHRANPFADGIVYPCGAVPWIEDSGLVSYGVNDERCCLRRVRLFPTSPVTPQRAQTGVGCPPVLQSRGAEPGFHWQWAAQQNGLTITMRRMSQLLTDYLTRCADAFNQATQRRPVHEQVVRIANTAILLRMAGPALVEATLPALAHLLANDALDAPPDITFHLWDGAATGVWPPHPPFSADDYRRYGQRAVAYAGSVSLMHAPTAGQLFAYDRASRQGYFWVEDASQLSIYERAAPLQTLFHWALREFGWQIIHAAAVGSAAGGVLLIGNTGAGKSTTALSCLTGDGLRLLSDDKCLARLDPTPQAFAAFSSGKIKADMLERLPHFREKLRGWDDHVKAGKGLVFLHPDYAERLVTTFPIRALVVTRVARQVRAAIHPLAPGEAFRVFGPSTVIWLPGAEAESYRFTAELIRRLPCYQLDLALEPARNIGAIRELLGRL